MSDKKNEILPKKTIGLWLDVNGDGSVGADDFFALVGNLSLKKNPPKEQTFEDKVKEVWGKNEHHLTLMSIRIQKRQTALKGWVRTLFSSGKDAKLNSILDNLSLQFEDNELGKFQTEYDLTLEAIKKFEGQLAEIKASQFMQTGETNSKITKAIKKFEENISKKKDVLNKVLSVYRNRMAKFGVELTSDQAEVLLSRVDARDVTKMTTVFAVISEMVKQLGNIKQVSGENIDVTKKYYAIYIGLLELQMLIQSDYLEKIDAKYLPGISVISNDALKLVAETKAILNSSPEQHRASYGQNLKSLEFAVQAAQLYESNLKSNKEKVYEAFAVVKEQHQLAENTLHTVKLSSELTTLIRQSENTYEELMSLQTPALLPFDNFELKREFEAITGRLRKNP